MGQRSKSTLLDGCPCWPRGRYGDFYFFPRTLMTLTFSELQLAATGLTDADRALPILAQPVFWILAGVSLILLIRAQFVKTPATLENGLWCLVLLATIFGATLVLPVSDPWMAAHGELAKKSAQFLGWQRTDPATFNRYDVLRMKRDLAHDLEVAESALVGMVAKGSDARDAELTVMRTLAMLRRDRTSAKNLQPPATK